MHDEEFNEIINKIITNRKFLKLKQEKHHIVTNRYEHNLSVAYNAYKLAKILNLDYVNITKAAVMHDFYFNNTFKSQRRKLLVHPYIALENAKKLGTIDDKQADIIMSHMFPFGKKVPRYKESFLVDFVDDIISFKEISIGSLKNLRNVLSFLMIIIFNQIK